MAAQRLFLRTRMVRAVRFLEGLDNPKTGEMPDLFENGLALVGSVDTVTRQLENLLKRLPFGGCSRGCTTA